MSQQHRAAGYNGTQQRSARARLQPLVESGGAVCPRCGQPILPGEAWDAGHRVDLVDDLRSRAEHAEHRRCNRSAGGRRGAAITNARRRAANNFRSW